jgi:Pirin-related protein
MSQTPLSEIQDSQGQNPMASSSSFPNLKRVASVQKYARLPVWPAWNGATLFLLSKILPNSMIAKLEDMFGGRVCPNFFQGDVTSPFIMMVHHVHSFASFDPLRFFQKQFILPEGFPAHPHRGFITLTYCIQGGMRHRDSLGHLQNYGAEARHGGCVAQWLVAGAGMLHEEMWDIDHGTDGIVSKQELFQLWINLPAQYKMTNPRLSLLRTASCSDDGVISDNVEVERGNKDDSSSRSTSFVEIPIVDRKGSRTIVLVGEYDGVISKLETYSPMSVLHVQMEANASWSMKCPRMFQTALIYMRAGSVLIPSQDSDHQLVDAHHTVTLSSYGENLHISSSGENGADFMLLLGQPLLEPVQARGSMVMNTWDEIDGAYADYASGKMGIPWNHDLTDEKWLSHVKEAPSMYK